MRSRYPRCQTKTGAPGFTGVFPTVNKSALREAILHQLRAELARQTSAAVSARDEAISEESRAENKWDTHSQEAAYLAEGQAKLAAEIGASIELYGTLPLPAFKPDDVIALGAVVEVGAAAPGGNARRACYVIGPRAGGLELSVDGREFLVLTPQSPLGRQLIGRRVGDTIQAAGRGVPAIQRIVAIE